MIQQVYILCWTSQVVLGVKNVPANAPDIRDAGSIPGRSPGGGDGCFSMEPHSTFRLCPHAQTRTRCCLACSRLSLCKVRPTGLSTGIQISNISRTTLKSSAVLGLFKCLLRVPPCSVSVIISF